MANEAEIKKYSERIYAALKKENVPDVNARIIIAQARHETANFSSNPFLKNNNIAGMKMPSIRKSPFIISSGTAAPAIEGSTPYAKYASIEDSARDVVHWLKYQNAEWNKIATPEDYASFLKSKNYYGPTSEFYGRQVRIFFDKMKNWIFNNPKKTMLIIAGSGLIIFALYVLLKKNDN